MRQQRNWSVLLGAAFLMATSAVGPGFLTQTTVFTQALSASFGFVILTSIIIDIGVQLNVWRIIAVSERRAQDIANAVLPGLGLFIALLIVLGGLAFNIGNVGGAGLGFNVLLGISAEAGALIAAAMAIAVFMVREAGKVMDRFAQAMGLLMILLIVFVALTSAPPVGEALVKTFAPDEVDLVAIITLVGGTVGGYITFAGGHRLLDAGVKGKAALPQVTTSAVSGITVASVIRVFLFLAALGVISKGLVLDPTNPPASVFQLAAGTIGYKLFGIVMLSAAITSVIGSAYTSVSFIKSFHRGRRDDFPGTAPLGHKDLYVTATCLNKQKLFVFSYETYPDMKVKDAVRASMSVPLYFEAVFIDSAGRIYEKRTRNDKLDIVVDGGIIGNFPITLFDSIAIDSLHRTFRIPNRQTLGVRIDSDAQIRNDALSQELVPLEINSLQDYVSAFYILALENLNRNQLQAGDWERTTSVSSAGITPRVKRLSKSQKALLINSGREHTAAYFKSKRAG